MTPEERERWYRSQGFIPPCEGAIYIPSSSPFSAGDHYLPDDGDLRVAWSQQVMSTGGVISYRLWWVPVRLLPC